MGLLLATLLAAPLVGPFVAPLAVEQHPKHVLDMHEAQDVIDGAAKDRDARALGGGKGAQNFVERSFDAEEMKIGARNHDFADLNLAKFDGAEDDFFFAGGEQAAFACLLDLDLQLFGGMRDTVARLGIDAHGFDN